jgi:hypothetical protein
MIMSGRQSGYWLNGMKDTQMQSYVMIFYNGLRLLSIPVLYNVQPKGMADFIVHHLQQ